MPYPDMDKDTVVEILRRATHTTQHAYMFQSVKKSLYIFIYKGTVTRAP